MFIGEASKDVKPMKQYWGKMEHLEARRYTPPWSFDPANRSYYGIGKYLGEAFGGKKIKN